MVQLDHLTRGRINFGVGPGALYSDAYQLGIEPTTQRRRMGEALGAIMRLLRGEVVTEQTEWFELREARLQMASYQQPHVPVFVAHATSPAGAQAAGRQGVGMLSVASSELAGGLGTMAQAWDVGERGGRAARQGDRSPQLARHHDHAPRRLARRSARGHPRGRARAQPRLLRHARDPLRGAAATVSTGSPKQPGVAIGTPDDADGGHRGGPRCLGRRGRHPHQPPRVGAHDAGGCGAATSCSPATSCRASRARRNRSRTASSGRREGHRTLFRPVRAAQRQAFIDAGIEVPDQLRPRGRSPEPEGQP